MFTALPLISNQLSQITCLSGVLYLSVLVCHFLLLECTTLNPQAMGMFSTRHNSNTVGISGWGEYLARASQLLEEPCEAQRCPGSTYYCILTSALISQSTLLYLDSNLSLGDD